MPESALPTHRVLPARGSLLGFDFGLARIGVAVGELETRHANPLLTIKDATRAGRFAAIAKLLDEWHPAALVVGLPTHLDGSEHAMTATCKRFADQLHGRFGIPVMTCDERLSSVAAENVLASSGKAGWRARKERLDAVAAQIILQQFLDGIDHENP